MTLFKKSILFFCALVMALALAACSWEDVTVTPGGVPVPNPDDKDKEHEPLTSNGTYGLTYDEGLDYYVVTGYHGTEEDVFIPAEWNGKRVIGINSYAFYENETVKTITITSAIESVSKNALVGDYTVFCEENTPAACQTDGCTALHPSGWHKDWYDKSADPAFVEWGCGSFGSFTWSCNEKDEIVITGYIESPVNLNIPERIGSRTVVAIASDAFKDCVSLESITIPESITYIGSFAFRYCSSLKSITVPKSVTAISSYLFDGCESLESVIISPETVSIGSSAFANCTSLKEIIIPATVEKMDMLVFHNCTNLTIYVDMLKTDVPDTWHERWNNSNCDVVYKNN